MRERKPSDDLPEFELNAAEFVERVNQLHNTFPNTNIQAVNFTKEKIDAKSNAVRWFVANNFLEFAKIETKNLRSLELVAKYKLMVQVQASNNNHYVLESFIEEVNHLASRLAGERITEYLFKDHGDANADDPRFTTTQNYMFTKS